MKRYFVYVMSNKSRRPYIGVTSDLVYRVYQHQHKLIEGFTSRYTFDMLVYYEDYSQVLSAIAREKELKGWRREKKLKLILAKNPDWADLSMEWREDPGWALEPDAGPRLKRNVGKD
ncbi:MAG TPA: GIY-YIG nuclease family protein [Terriglobales bacterium]|nr:GIY-YIG nuclease family protein [Terriglobales bacterium]